MKLVKKNWLLTLAVLVLAMVLTACNDKDDTDAAPDSLDEVRLGYFPNLTHISTIISLEKGYLKEALGKDIKLTTTFNHM